MVTRRDFIGYLSAGALGMLGPHSKGNGNALGPSHIEAADGLRGPTAEFAPVEFGKREFARAAAQQKLRIAVETAVVPGPAESYTIETGAKPRITGGDTRGLMYGLLEAANQLETHGKLLSKKGAPYVQMRGIRYFILNKDLDDEWYYSHDYWDEYFAMLARERLNRFNLVFGSQTNYLVPPYAFWVEVPEFPEIRVPGLTEAQRERNFRTLQYISQAAADHGVDFTLGIWEQNVWPSMKPSVKGVTNQNVGPYTHAALKKVLQQCPGIRSVQIRTNVESGIPADQELSFYGDYFYPAVRDCGRKVTLDLRAWILAPGMLDAVSKSGLPLRVSSKYWAEFLGRPYQPATTYPAYSYINLLEKPRPYEFFWELWGLGSNQLLLWGNPEYVRRAVSTFGLGGGVGFEIDPPLATKGYGNRPGKWGIFTDSQKDRVFWKWEFERYWLFYMLWGRLSYDPGAPDSVWLKELERRFGKAAGQVLDAYKQSSQVINEIVAAHLADPNMYIWPEINPGGLIDDYIDVKPSDWSYIATVPEAVQNHINGVASAKQTPQQTSELLDSLATKVDRAVEQARKKIEGQNTEWKSSEPDFHVLGHMARYHARKMVAAYQLEYFYQTADEAALESAKEELEKAVLVWEDLVRLTDGLYPEQMTFGPDDMGDWKDKLPYVRYDPVLIADREKIFKRFGKFDFGFDFGSSPRKPRGASYRNTYYVLHNNVEPRFSLVSAETAYQDSAGYGWVGSGDREVVGIPLTPYLEVRSVAKDPKHLPRDVLFRDYIRGRGGQQFRVKTPPGTYSVMFLHPDHSSTAAVLQAADSSLTVPFPEGEWSVSGLVIKHSPSSEKAAVETQSKSLPRPAMAHMPPQATQEGRPLNLVLEIRNRKEVSTVRLHYRAVNQRAKFKTLEASPEHTAFTIPGADISAKWDLMYYFEVLNKQNGGWFQPDPLVATPYYVVKVQS